MKSGLVLLLLAFLLVAMPAAATDFASVDFLELRQDVAETESVIKEGVTVISDGEYMAALSVASYIGLVDESRYMINSHYWATVQNICRLGLFSDKEAPTLRGGLIRM